MSPPDGLPDPFRRSQLRPQEGPRATPRRRPSCCDPGRALRHPSRRDHRRHRLAPTLRRTRMARPHEGQPHRLSRGRAPSVGRVPRQGCRHHEPTCRCWRWRNESSVHLPILPKSAHGGRPVSVRAAAEPPRRDLPRLNPRRSAHGRVRKSSAGRKMGPELLNPSLAFDKVEPALTKQRRDLLTAERTYDDDEDSMVVTRHGLRRPQCTERRDRVGSESCPRCCRAVHLCPTEKRNPQASIRPTFVPFRQRQPNRNEAVLRRVHGDFRMEAIGPPLISLVKPLEPRLPCAFPG